MRAVLWDLDDTLLNTRAPRMRALAHAYASCLGEDVDPDDLWRSHQGGTLEDLGRRLLGTEYSRFTTAYRDHYYGSPRRIRPYAGVEATLEQCRALGLALGVVTSKVSWGAAEELQQAGLLQHFGVVVAFDDTDTHKPDPEPLFTALERMLIDDPQSAAYIGDSPADVLAARNAGCRSIAALWGTLDEGQLREAEPDAVAAAPEQVLAALAFEVTL